MNRRDLLKAAIAGGAGLALPRVGRALADPCFVWIGDPHLNLQGSPYTTWSTQCAWIAAHQAAWNIQGIFCAGDYTLGDFGMSGTEITAAWTVGWSVIDAMALPWISCAGNHDYDAEDQRTRRTTIFDAQIGYSRISGKSWYGGYYARANGSKANQYIKFTYDGRKFLFMAFELYPDQLAINWASTVLQQHKDYETVLMTHALLDTAAVPLNDADANTYVNTPTLNSGTGYNGGKLIEWAKQWSQVRGFWCGHTLQFSKYGGYRYDRGISKTDIHGIFSDWQGASPSSQVILLITVSPTGASVRAWNTTTDAEDRTYAPIVLPWGGAAVAPVGFPF